MRTVLGVLACLTFCASARAEDAVTRANRSAYDLAMKCFTAYGVALGDAKDAGRPAEARTLEAGAHQAFDVGDKLGTVLQYEGGRVTRDFQMVQARELPKMVKDKVYLSNSIRYCKAAGL